MQHTRHSCQILIKLEFSRQIFEKKLKHQISPKFVELEPSRSMRMDGWMDGRPSRTDGRTDRQTDRHDEANSRFPQFCERALKPSSLIHQTCFICFLFTVRCHDYYSAVYER
jgi:hypothetical protein